MRIPSVAAVVALSLVLAAPLASQDEGTIKLSSSLRGRTYCNAKLKAQGFLLVPSGGGPPIAFRSDLTGAAQVRAPAGDYEVVVPDTMLLVGNCVTWRVPAHIERGSTLKLDLTNANATTLRPHTDTTRGDSAMMVAQIRRWEGALLPVSTGMRIGTGLLVDGAGLVLTSARLTELDSLATVELDPGTRLRAVVVLRDSASGLAVLRMAPEALAGRPVAELTAGVTTAPGTFVTVLYRRPGSSGRAIWTRIEDTSAGTLRLDLPMAFAFDGGIAVAPSGDLIGMVNAVRRAPCATPEPNAAPIGPAIPLLQAARARTASLPAPDTTRLTPWPTDSFSAAMLDSIADASPLDKYDGVEALTAGHFRVRLETPPLLLVNERADDVARNKAVDQWASKARDEDKACYQQLERAPARRTAQNRELAMIELHVDAAVSSSGGMSLYGIIPLEKAFIRMEGDLGGAIIYRNGAPVTPIFGGTDWRSHRLHTPEGEWADSAHIGWYILPATIFAPDDNGAPPTIAVYLPDMRNPDEPSCLTLAPAAVALLWNDFLPVYASRTPPGLRANPKAKPITPRPPAGKACPAAGGRRPF